MSDRMHDNPFADPEWPFEFMFAPENDIMGLPVLTDCDPGDENDSLAAACTCTILPADGLVAYVEVCSPCNRRLVKAAEGICIDATRL